MLSRTTNTFTSATRVSPRYDQVDGRHLPPATVALFRALWLRRGQWRSYENLVFSVEPPTRAAFEARLAQLRRALPRDMRIEHRHEVIRRGVPGSYETEILDEYRLTTGETLPDPVAPPPPPEDFEPDFISLEDLREEETA